MESYQHQKDGFLLSSLEPCSFDEKAIEGILIELESDQFVDGSNEETIKLVEDVVVVANIGVPTHIATEFLVVHSTSIAQDIVAA